MAANKQARASSVATKILLSGAPTLGSIMLCFQRSQLREEKGMEHETSAVVLPHSIVLSHSQCEARSLLTRSCTAGEQSTALR